MSSAVVEDDYQLMIMGKGKNFVKQVADVFEAAEEAFRRVRLPTAKHKLNFLASTGKWQRDFPRGAAGVRYRVQSTRNLGVDFTLGKRRRTTVASARLEKVAAKKVKFKIMTKYGVRTRVPVMTVINSATTYGWGVSGPPQLS